MPIWGGSNYPVALDTYTGSPQVDNVDIVWADHPNSLAAAIEAIQAKLGITGGVATGFGGVSFDDVAANPGVAGVPTLWVDNSSGSPYALKYTDDTGTTFDLTAGGGGGSLQVSYGLGNTIAATSADGAISFSVANTQNIPVLSLTQNDATNHPATLSLVNNATYDPGTGAGASLDLSGVSGSIHSTCVTGLLMVASSAGVTALGFGNSGFGAYNGIIDIGSVDMTGGADPEVYLRSYSLSTSDQYIHVQAGPTGATGGSSTLNLKSITGSNTGATVASTDILAHAQGNNAGSNASVSILAYADGIVAAGTATVTIEARRDAGAGDTGSSITLGQEIVFTDQNKVASTYLGDLKLSEDSGEWDTFESNYGEVSLLNAINQAAGGGGGSYWSRTGTTLYPATAGDDVEIDLGAVTTGDAFVVENDGGTGFVASELSIGVQGAGGFDWAKVGAGRHDISGEGNDQNYLFFETNGSRTGWIGLDGSDCEFWLGTGTNTSYMHLYSSASSNPKIYFRRALTGASGGYIGYDHVDDAINLSPANYTRCLIDSSSLYMTFNSAYGNISTEQANDIDIAESPTTVDSYTPSANGATMWLYSVHNLSGSNMRAGTIVIAHNMSNVVTSLAETATTDVGDTSPVSFAASMAGGVVSLTCSVTTDNWYVRVVRIGTDRLGSI